MKKLLPAIIGLSLLAAANVQASPVIKKYTLVNTAWFDSTIKVTRWVPIRGAKKVYIRTFSRISAAFSVGMADSAYSDSIGTWVTVFGDSMVGTSYDTVGVAGTYPTYGDTTAITGTQADSLKMVAVGSAAVNVPLRKALTGHGRYTTIYPIKSGNVTLDDSGILMPQAFRLRLTPYRRATPETEQATVPHRVNGVKGLTVEAYVYFENP